MVDTADGDESARIGQLESAEVTAGSRADNISPAPVPSVATLGNGLPAPPPPSPDFQKNHLTLTVTLDDAEPQRDLYTLAEESPPETAQQRLRRESEQQPQQVSHPPVASYEELATNTMNDIMAGLGLVGLMMDVQPPPPDGVDEAEDDWGKMWLG